MSESQGRDLKPPVDGMFYEIFGFGTFFRYHNFQNEIDAWESTVQWIVINILSQTYYKKQEVFSHFPRGLERSI